MSKKIKFIDLFCGLGGIRLGFQNSLIKRGLDWECVLSSDIKKSAIKTYQLNFKEVVGGDLKKISTNDLGSFDFLLGGFPCQAFSSAGKRMGFEDTRGTLFFEVARILKEKKPKAFILENVEGLVLHDFGKTLKTILSTLDEVGYDFSWRVLNSKDFGLAQGRKRIYIVGVKKVYKINMEDLFNFSTDFKRVVFKDLRDYGLEVVNSKFNKLLIASCNDLRLLGGKCIRDKRGGDHNLHSWDLGLRGIVTSRQKTLMNTLSSKWRYKKWAVENNAVWFDGMPLSFNQIKTFINYKGLEKDLNILKDLGYLRLSYPKDYKVVDGVKTKVSRTDLPLGYSLSAGKLSFEFSNILDDYNITPTIVATDANRLGVIEKNGLRQLSANELKKLFGFPDWYKVEHLTKGELFDLFGNSVAVNVVEAVSDNLIKLLKNKI
jgi:DNA (cytosine-5)-methyltransferase 1